MYALHQELAYYRTSILYGRKNKKMLSDQRASGDVKQLSNINGTFFYESELIEPK